MEEWIAEDCMTEYLMNGAGAIRAPMAYPAFCIDRDLNELDPSSKDKYREYYLDFADAGLVREAEQQQEKQRGCVGCGD
jgi:hypothetical protein